jgi:DNA-binding XRE family transcriptional regulator
VQRDFELRRIALGLSRVELAAKIGVSAEEVELIESMPLGSEVEFLHNLALSLLELAGTRFRAAS